MQCHSNRIRLARLIVEKNDPAYFIWLPTRQKCSSENLMISVKKFGGGGDRFLAAETETENIIWISDFRPIFVPIVKFYKKYYNFLIINLFMSSFKLITNR